MRLFKELDLNIQYFDEAFKDCGDIVRRKFFSGGENGVFLYVMHADSMVDRIVVEQTVIAKLMNTELPSFKADIYRVLKETGLSTPSLSEEASADKVSLAVMSGDTVVLVDGFDSAFIISSRGFPNRGISAAETEVVVQGSKEAFSEVFRMNTVLLRRRIRDTNLKVKQFKVGRRSETDVALIYLGDVVRLDILEEAEKRLSSIDIDAVLDSGYIEQFIEDSWLSPFPQTIVTERPDKAAAAILEGRIVIIVDNSPFALIIPSTFNSFFQSPEDYYQRFNIMSFTRALRFFAAVIAVCLPGLYIAVSVYHPSMIPVLLAFKMAGSQAMVPFPAVIEVLIMELAFELLREAGIRLPGAVGGAIGIIGGLIVGQAAVEAGLVSPIVVIVTAATGISSFAIPTYQLMNGYRLTKYLVIILSAVLGLFGFWAAVLVILIHLSSLKSYGIPYLYPFVSAEMNGYSDLKDSIFRVPTRFMKKRPFFADPKQSIRLKRGKGVK